MRRSIRVVGPSIALLVLAVSADLGCSATLDGSGAPDAGADGGMAQEAPPPADAAAAPDAALAIDDAKIEEASFPTRLRCGESGTATVTVRNTGNTTWLNGGYRLGTVDDEDPFHRVGTRVYLGNAATVPPGASWRFTIPLVAPTSAGDHVTDWRMVHEGVQWFGEISRHTIAVACGGTRPPDPAPGQKLPLPDMRQVVQAVHAADPQLISASCRDQGGNWRFMDAVVDALRAVDTRWGYNWKRGVVGDASQDAIDYHFGAGPDEGSTDVYIIDIIGGHCGPNPQPAWIDVTEATRQGGTIGRWTGRGRF